MSRVVLMVVGLSIVLISPIPSLAWATEGESFKSSGVFTLEIPELAYVLNCKESGSGKVGVEADLTMSECVVENYGKDCEVEPFSIHLSSSYLTSEFVMITTGTLCFWFEEVVWVPVALKVESFEEKEGTAKVHLFGNTAFMPYPASMSITSTWIF